MFEGLSKVERFIAVAVPICILIYFADEARKIANWIS